jgi:dephospho-CoA kinase
MIALSGLPGSGKTTIARAIAEVTGGQVIGFGDHVRKLAALSGRPANRTELQDLGDAAVAENPIAFLEAVIAPAGDDWNILILDGLRHLSLLGPLRNAALEREARFVHVHLAIAPETRLARLAERGVPLKVTEQADRHRVEVDGWSALADRADVRLDASLPLDEEVRIITEGLTAP